jgi:TonB family protein
MKIPIVLLLIMALLTSVYAERFEVNGGIITDTTTGLEWRLGPDSDTDWYEADSWVKGLGDTWRMPSLSELQELYNAGITFSNWGPFENSGGWIWSGEVRDSLSAWGFNFDFGNGGWVTSDYGITKRGCAVRSVISESERDSEQVSFSASASGAALDLGYRSMSDIRSGINVVKSSVLTDYASLLESKPGVGGTITISFSITPNGSVTGVSVSCPGELACLQETVTSAVQGLNFGSAPEQTDNLPVTVPLNLIPPQ